VFGPDEISIVLRFSHKLKKKFCCQIPRLYPKSVSKVMRNVFRTFHCMLSPNRKHRNASSKLTMFRDMLSER
jgi:hypothetical protein